MSSSTLQASLLLHPPHHSSFKPNHHRPSLFSSSLRFNPQSLSSFLLSSRFHPIPCSLRQDNVASDSDFLPKDSSSGEVTDSAESSLVPELETSSVDGDDGTTSSETTISGGGEERDGGKKEDSKSKFRIDLHRN